VAAALADYSWRHEQLHVIRVRAHFETIRQLEEHSAEFAAVYNRPPAAPTTPGIHTIATWWLHTTPVIGRPPLPARIPTGAAA
jgi:hypothetical protein